MEKRDTLIREAGTLDYETANQLLACTTKQEFCAIADEHNLVLEDVKVTNQKKELCTVFFKDGPNGETTSIGPVNRACVRYEYYG